MAKISAKSRKGLPKSEFGLPASRKYPVDTKARAANAKARATQQVKAGNLAPSAKAQIDAKANAKLGTYQGPGKQMGNAKSRTGKTRSWTGA